MKVKDPNKQKIVCRFGETHIKQEKLLIKATNFIQVQRVFCKRLESSTIAVNATQLSEEVLK